MLDLMTKRQCRKLTSISTQHSVITFLSAGQKSALCKRTKANLSQINLAKTVVESLKPKIQIKFKFNIKELRVSFQ